MIGVNGKFSIVSFLFNFIKILRNALYNNLCSVCNTSSVTQFTKPLNVSKPLCSSKVTKRNVCNASSVSKLIKPLNVSKTLFQ